MEVYERVQKKWEAEKNSDDGYAHQAFTQGEGK
jgi:hypothetical protein